MVRTSPGAVGREGPMVPTPAMPRSLIRFVDLAEIDDLVAAFRTALDIPVSLLGAHGEVVSGAQAFCRHCMPSDWHQGVLPFVATGGQFTCRHGLSCLIVPVRARHGDPLAAVAVGPIRLTRVEDVVDDTRPEGESAAQAGSRGEPAAALFPYTRAEAAARLLARSFETIAREAEIAGESADLEAVHQQSNRDLSVLYAVARALNSSADVQTMLDQLVAMLGELLDGDVVVIGLIEGHELVNSASSGLRTLEAKQGRLKLGEGLAGRVAQSGQPLVTLDMQADPREYMTATNTREQLHGYLGVPIQPGERTIGVLSLYYRRARLASEGEMHVLAHIAELIGIALRPPGVVPGDSPASGPPCLMDHARPNQRAMARIHEIHDQLSQIVLHDGGLSAIVTTLARLLNAQVALEDASHHLLASGEPNPSTNTARNTVERSNGAVTPPQATLDQEVQLLYAVAREARKPSTFPAIPRVGITRGRIVAPVLVGADLLGYLVIADEPSLQVDTQMLAISHATTVIALEMLKQRTSIEFERRLRGETLEELVDGDFHDIDRLHRKAEFLGHNLAVPHVLIAISVNRTEIAGNAARRVSRASSTDILQDVASIHGKNAMLMSRSDGVGLALPIVAGDMAEARRVVTAFQRDALRRGIDGIRIGVGRLCLRLEDYPHAWVEARRALDFARSLDVPQGMVVYDDLGVSRLLLDLPDVSEAVTFAHQLLAPLEAHDEKHKTLLLETLEAFLAVNGVLQRAASALSIHVNTLTYRLQRIQELTGLDLRDSDNRLEAHVAVKIRRVVRRAAV